MTFDPWIQVTTLGPGIKRLGYKQTPGTVMWSCGTGRSSNLEQREVLVKCHTAARSIQALTQVNKILWSTSTIKQNITDQRNGQSDSYCICTLFGNGTIIAFENLFKTTQMNPKYSEQTVTSDDRILGKSKINSARLRLEWVTREFVKTWFAIISRVHKLTVEQLSSVYDQHHFNCLLTRLWLRWEMFALSRKYFWIV